MCAGGEQVDVHRFDVDRDVADGLNRVGMEKDLLFAADSAQFGDRLNRADFVVGHHDGNERRLRGDGCRQRFLRDEAFAVYGQIGDGKALFFQAFCRMQNRVVLDLRGDDVSAALFIFIGCAEKDVVIRFRAAAGENDFVGFGVDNGGNRLARFVQRFPRFVGERIN